MGTNYYWTEEPCPNPCKHCKDESRMHIGKSSGGWCFALHVYPEQGINTLGDWKVMFAQPGSRITNEYGDTVPVHEMLRIITERSWKRESNTVPYGYASEVDFARRNSARIGPNGCWRHAVDGVHCIGNGDGTWDYIAGEFS